MSLERDFPEKFPCQIVRPKGEGVPYLFNSPHSGRNYPDAFRQLSCLNAFDLRLSEDRFVDRFFLPLAEEGATLMLAEFPRAYLDVNREFFELDASMFEDRLPHFVPAPTLRVAAGFGCVPRLVASGKPIYDRKLPSSEALGRISSIYRPYHQYLEEELRALKARHGYAILIDCHSMPGHSPALMGAKPQADMILGDVYGRSCAPALTNYASTLLEEMGYHVARNQPYAGGYITNHYGRPLQHVHALQLEINRNLYLERETLAINAYFDRLQAHMVEFGRRLMAMAQDVFFQTRDAAE